MLTFAVNVCRKIFDLGQNSFKKHVIFFSLKILLKLRRRILQKPHLKAHAILLSRLVFSPENFLHFHNRHSNTNSFSWPEDLSVIFKLPVRSEMKIREQTGDLNIRK